MLPALASLALATAGCPQQKSGPTKAEVKASWAAAEDELQGRLKAVAPRLEAMVRTGRPEAQELLQALDGAQNEFHKTRVTVGGELDALPLLTDESLEPLSGRFTAAQRRFESRLASAETLFKPADEATKKALPSDEGEAQPRPVGDKGN